MGKKIYKYNFTNEEEELVQKLIQRFANKEIILKYKINLIGTFREEYPTLEIGLNKLHSIHEEQNCSVFLYVTTVTKQEYEVYKINKDGTLALTFEIIRQAKLYAI